MDLTTTSGSLTAEQSALPDAWAERLFQRMEDRYGALWADRYGAFPRDRVKRSWAEDLCDMTREELARGVAACRDSKFPPTLAEFRAMCRPPLDYESAFLEAVEQMRLREQRQDRWSSALLYWAAVKVGRDLTQHPYSALKGRWQAAVNAARAEMDSGKLPLVVPERLVALPGASGVTISKDKAKAHIDAMMAQLAQKLVRAA